MKHKKVIFEGPMVLALAILITAHFMGLCVNGLCSDDWLIKNLLLGSTIECISFFYLHKYIKSCGLYLYRETRNPNVSINYYRKIRGYSIIAGIYGFIIFMQPKAIEPENIKGTFLIASIIISFALSVLITTSLDINRIKNRRLGNKCTKKNLGGNNLDFLN